MKLPKLKWYLRLVIAVLSPLLVACTNGTTGSSSSTDPASTLASDVTVTAEEINNPNDPFVPGFVNHPTPESSLDFSAFENMGCPANERGRRLCETDSPLRELGCNLLVEPSPLLGFLEPAYPLIICVVKPSLDGGDFITEVNRIREEGSFITAVGGLDPEFYRYVVVQNGEVEILETAEEFQQVFASIESPEEALSYALALTKATAMYGLSYSPDLIYEISELEDTYVTELPEGFLINLYYYQEIGCGPHMIELVEMRVTNAGELEELARTPAFRNPDEDNLCVD